MCSTVTCQLIVKPFIYRSRQLSQTKVKLDQIKKKCMILPSYCINWTGSLCNSHVPLVSSGVHLALCPPSCTHLTLHPLYLLHFLWVIIWLPLFRNVRELGCMGDLVNKDCNVAMTFLIVGTYSSYLELLV